MSMPENHIQIILDAMGDVVQAGDTITIAETKLAVNLYGPLAKTNIEAAANDLMTVIADAAESIRSAKETLLGTM